MLRLFSFSLFARIDLLALVLDAAERGLSGSDFSSFPRVGKPDKEGRVQRRVTT